MGILLAVVVGMTLFSGCKGKAPEEEETKKHQEEQKTEDEEAATPEATDPVNGDTETKHPSEEAGENEENTEEPTKEILKNFEAVTLSGDTFTEADLAEKDMTVINFWATYCGPCISEMPDLAEFSESLPERVQVVTVCLDGSIKADEAAEILEETGFDGITLLSGDDDFEVLCYSVMYTPTTIFVDSEGNLAGDVIIGGQVDFQKVYTEALNKALQESGKEEVVLNEE